MKDLLLVVLVCSYLAPALPSRQPNQAESVKQSTEHQQAVANHGTSANQHNRSTPQESAQPKGRLEWRPRLQDQGGLDYKASREQQEDSSVSRDSAFQQQPSVFAQEDRHSISQYQQPYPYLLEQLTQWEEQGTGSEAVPSKLSLKEGLPNSPQQRKEGLAHLDSRESTPAVTASPFNNDTRGNDRVLRAGPARIGSKAAKYSCAGGLQSTIPPRQKLSQLQLLQKAVANNDQLVCKRCVFVLTSARCASTTFMDMLNQICGYAVLGENFSIFEKMMAVYRGFPVQDGSWYLGSFRSHLQGQCHWQMAWYTEFKQKDVLDQLKAMFYNLYQCFDQRRVVGFKEIRPANISSISYYAKYVSFLLQLCDDPKIIFLARENREKQALSPMQKNRHGKETALKYLELKHTAMVEIAKKYPSRIKLVYTEQMLKHDEVVADVLEFLGEDPTLKLRRDRLRQCKR